MVMLSRSVRFSHRPRLAAAAALLLPLVFGCAKGDVGAPCNHGDVEPPESKLVTFPALSCDDLLCVYADEDEPPAEGCSDNLDCNLSGESKFECVMDSATGEGACKLRVDYVLERSMCSKKCSSDDDCKDGGPTEQVVVEDTNCSTGFSCARIQSLGKFCCEKLCVCNDDLGVTAELDTKCAASSQEGCCKNADDTPTDPLPEACGKA